MFWPWFGRGDLVVAEVRRFWLVLPQPASARIASLAPKSENYNVLATCLTSSSARGCLACERWSYRLRVHNEPSSLSR